MSLVKESHDPYGYKKLLVYAKAEQLLDACTKLTTTFPREKTLIALADQMDRSARSVKQNVVEGWKRNTTKEYHQFLGFSLGANAELEEDCNDIIKGMYKGIKGEEKGERGGMGKGEGEARGGMWALAEVEKLPFYPLNSHLPPLIQLKLQCKELNFLLQKLQKSLQIRVEEGKQIFGEKKSEERVLADLMAAGGFTRLPDGRVVEKSDHA